MDDADLEIYHLAWPMRDGFGVALSVILLISEKNEKNRCGGAVSLLIGALITNVALKNLGCPYPGP